MFPNIHEFEEWKREIYPKYWIRKSCKYGLDNYCRGLIKLITEGQPKSAFELGIGTGYPFAENLLSAGINVAGCDISKVLINELNSSFPTIISCVGGYEDLNQVKIAINQKFDLVYCLRSTWYFTDMAAAIDFMLYFVRPGGRVIFDIMNKDSKWNRTMVLKKNFLFPVTVAKNIIKFVINRLVSDRYMIDILFGVREIMYSQSQIDSILKNRGLKYEILNQEQISARAEMKMGEGPFSSDQKLVYVVHIS